MPFGMTFWISRAGFTALLLCSRSLHYVASASGRAQVAALEFETPTRESDRSSIAVRDNCVGRAQCQLALGAGRG